MSLQPPTAVRSAREKSPVQEKIAMFMQNSAGAQDPRNLGNLEYGRPVVGSKTEARGLRAHAHVFREILELCEIIHTDGDIRFVDDDGVERIGILFGDLFRIYTIISDKCVGLLLRARKHSLVTFEGETLFQRRDDNTPIFLTKPIAVIKQQLTASIKGEDHTVPWHTGVIGTGAT
ncbi:hypothetical protein RUM44_011784 [Polyplax serrata]|uniref:Costars domain-containing protein n=1 Tax=Polyplax serrata TaxID=468196 RepID=A0ABR1AR32_POLSC